MEGRRWRMEEHVGGPRWMEVAVFVLVALSSYSRPSELLRCTVYSLVPPLRNTLNEWSLLLSPEQEGHPSKTGEYDTSLTLDSPWGPVVFQASKKQHASTPLWDFNYGEFVKEFKLVAEALHLELSPYQMRHSGPSIDRARNLRSQLEVQRRGTWKSPKSVLRYEKSARLAAGFLELPQRLRVHCQLCEERLGDAILGRWTPPAPP